MSKTKTQYVCNLCGASYPKWSGQCASCQEWNSLEEQLEKSSSQRYIGISKTTPLQKLSQIKLEDYGRISTMIPEFDRVLGGGLVDSGVVLIGGDPGIGKSTLLLQTLANLCEAGESVVYVSGDFYLFFLNCCPGQQVSVQRRQM